MTLEITSGRIWGKDLQFRGHDAGRHIGKCHTRKLMNIRIVMRKILLTTRDESTQEWIWFFEHLSPENTV